MVVDPNLIDNTDESLIASFLNTIYSFCDQDTYVTSDIGIHVLRMYDIKWGPEKIHYKDIW